MPGKIVCTFEKYDQALNKARSKKYELSIQFAPDGFSFCLFDTETNKFLALVSYSCQGFNDTDDLASELETICKKSEWLNNLSYARVRILYESQKTTLIPDPLFDISEKQNIADFSYQKPSGDIIVTDKLKNPDAHIIYHLPENIINVFDKLFPGNKIVSHAGILIEILLILFKNQPEQKRVFINARNSFFDIVITEGKKLLFFNSFKYSTKEDFIYYLIFVIEQLNLNPEEIELRLSGFINKQSNLFDYAYKYIRNIQFLSFSNTFQYSYIFNEVPKHYYFNLVNSMLCEL